MADEDYEVRSTSWCPTCVMVQPDEPVGDECPNCATSELLNGPYIYVCTHCELTYLEARDAEGCCGTTE